MLEASTILTTFTRIALGLLGIGSLVVAGYALSKLGTASLDSPRWTFVLAGGLALVSVSPENRLIVLDYSIGPVWLDESRKSVEKAFGPGTRSGRCGASYFGGRLEVNYCPKEDPTRYVAAIWTHWAGFHTRSGLRVGASRQMASSIPGVICGSGYCDHYLRPRHADGPVTDITTRHRTVTKISVFFG